MSPSEPSSKPHSKNSLPTPSYTFTQIIDADHFTIQQLASKIRKLLPTPTLLSSPTTPDLSALIPILQEATWRLIRHDLSEDIIMRPAFTTVLGAEGTKMADHDRSDHAHGRQALLEILQQVATIQSQLAQPPPSPSSTPTADQSQTSLLHDLTATITTTLNTLGEHMALESGQFLPYFETLISEQTSRDLAAGYMSTLVVTPYLSVPSTKTSTRPGTAAGGQSDAPMFPGGVMEYVSLPLEELRKRYETLVARADESQDVAAYVGDAVAREVAALRVEKWVGMNEQKGRSTGLSESRHAAKDLASRPLAVSEGSEVKGSNREVRMRSKKSGKL